MMTDKQFRELELKAQIAPSQSQWPTEHLHWQHIGMAANEARSLGANSSRWSMRSRRTIAA
jgi:hypothetical protein